MSTSRSTSPSPPIDEGTTPATDGTESVRAGRSDSSPGRVIEKTPEMVEFLIRLERAISSAPETLDAIHEVASRADRLLERLGDTIHEAGARDDAIRKSTLDLDRACATADEVRDGLTGFTDQLADVCDGADEKVIALLKTLKSGAAAREQLEELTTRATTAAGELESVTRSHEQTLRAATDRCLAEVKEAIAVQSAEMQRHREMIRRLGKLSREDKDRADAFVERQERRLAEVANESVAGLERTIHRRLSEVKRTLDKDLAEQVASVEQAIEKSSELAIEVGRSLDDRIRESETRVEDIVTTREARLAEVAEQCVSNIEGSFKAELEQLKQEFERQMSSHRESADCVVRGVTEVTAEAERAGDLLIEKRDDIESQVRSLAETHKKIVDSSAEYRALGAEIRPAIASLNECVEGSGETVGKIERLIQDVWTLTTTAQQRAQQLTERCDLAVSESERIEKLREAAEVHASTLAGQNLSARRRTEKLDKVSRKTEGLIERVEKAADAAADSAAKMEQSADSATRYHEAVRATLGTAEEVIQRLDDGVSASKAAADRAEKQQGEAEAAFEQMSIDADTYRALAEKLEKSQAQGVEAAREFEETLGAGAKLRDDLSVLTERASSSSRDMAQTLALLTERYERLEGSDEAVREFLECSEQIRMKLQQLQTRTDAFQHQLNSMLADPRKIVTDAKAQASQLESVCEAVRKIFAGLSQASLQANRDITKFAKVSREANGRLTQISAETQRAGQSLREWVEEALHVQSRLAKTVAQAPPISPTRPATDLGDLARTAAETIPEILRASDDRRVRLPHVGARGVTRPSSTEASTDELNRVADESVLEEVEG